MADLVITPSDVQRSGTAGTFRAVEYGEAINAGELVYQSTTDQKYYKADANDPTKPASTGQLAVAVASAGADQQGVVCRSNATISLGAGVMTQGEIYVSSSNAIGKMAPAADLVAGADLTIVGYAQTDALLEIQLQVTNVTKA